MFNPSPKPSSSRGTGRDFTNRPIAICRDKLSCNEEHFYPLFDPCHTAKIFCLCMPANWVYVNARDRYGNTTPWIGEPGCFRRMFVVNGGMSPYQRPIYGRFQPSSFVMDTQIPWPNCGFREQARPFITCYRIIVPTARLTITHQQYLTS